MITLREHIAELERERVGLQLALDNNTRMLRDLRHQLAVEPTPSPGKDCSELRSYIPEVGGWVR